MLLKKLKDRNLIEKVQVDSAGTHNFHPNEPPDKRSQMHASQRGYDLSNLRARRVVDTDFEKFDLILTMDWDNRTLLEERCPAKYLSKIRGLAEFLQNNVSTVIPDPYYSNEEGFEYVLDLIEDATDGLIKSVIEKLP
jgi:protein-tyrosine phosphatase